MLCQAAVPSFTGRWGSRLGHLCLHSTWPLPCPGSKFETFSFVPSPSSSPTSHIFLVNLHLSIIAPSPAMLTPWILPRVYPPGRTPPMSGTWVCEARDSAIHAAMVGLASFLLKRMYASHLYQGFPPKYLLRVPHLPSCNMTRKSQFLWPHGDQMPAWSHFCPVNSLNSHPPLNCW